MTLLREIEIGATDAAPIGQALSWVQVSSPVGCAAAALHLSWVSAHGGFEPQPDRIKGVRVSGYSKPPSTIRKIPRPTEAEIVRMAWRSGAPDLVRSEFCALFDRHPGADPHEHRYGLVSHFGSMSYGNSLGRLDITISDGRTDDMIEEAAARGYVSYRFGLGRAVLAGGIECRTDDPSLSAAGTRCTPPPAWALSDEPLGRWPDDEADGHQTCWTFVAEGRAKLISVAKWMERYA